MAKIKKKKEAPPAMFRQVERVLAERPISKKRGGASRGDERVVLRYSVTPSGKRSRGRVTVEKVES
jgi:hypothetical protein